jgi:GxxExxY protein
MTEIILKDEAYVIIAAAIEVHRELGPGFAEPVYQEAHEIELGRRNVPFEVQRPLVIHYKGQRLPSCPSWISTSLRVLRGCYLLRT